MGAAPKANGARRRDRTAERDRTAQLERLVDVHTFDAGRAARARAGSAGFADVRVCGEELVANAYGWFLRALEADVEPEIVPRAGTSSPSAATSRCSASTARLLEPRLPASLFYNLLLSARKPG